MSAVGDLGSREARGPKLVRRGRALFYGAALALCVNTCGERVEVGSDAERAGLAGSVGTNTGGTGAKGGTLGGGNGGALNASGGSAGAEDCVPASCNGKVYRCGDCKDNDADGLIDAADPDCVGPCDDTEDSYYLGLPSGGERCQEDCHFDRNAGGGNDRCAWNFRCDEHSVASSGYAPSGDASCAYDASLASCATLRASQPQSCIDTCRPLTPNGCDCFGCCELPARSGHTVWLGSTGADGQGSCTRATLGDPTKCKPCTQVPSCLNPCTGCELCVGETTLPAHCAAQAPLCEAGVVACEAGGKCPLNEFCISGCCIDVPR